MSWKLPCEIVQDLLPSYVDGVTGPVTGEAVRDHLDACESCRESWERMRAPEKTVSPEERAELDFLKRTKRRHRLAMAVGVAAAVLAVTAIVLVRTYCIGSPISGRALDCSGVDVNGRTLTLQGEVMDESRGVSDVDFHEEDGVVTATVKVTRRSPFHREQFRADYTASEDIRQVWVDNQVIWDRGERIGAWVRAVYATRHPYIGDVSANGKTALAVGVAAQLGEFRSELRTDQEPFCWTVVLENQVPATEREQYEACMRGFACVMLAVIDNLGEVTFTCPMDGGTETLTVTTAQADEFAGQSIKECGRSPKDLQKLMRKIELIRQGTPRIP